MMHLWAKWYVKAAVVVVAAVLGAFVSGILAHHIFTYEYPYYAPIDFGRSRATETLVLWFTLAGGVVGFIIVLVVLFRHFSFRRFSNKLRLAQLKLLFAQLKLLWNTRRASGPVEREPRLLLYVFGGWAAAMLLGALGDRDYAYYTLLRWVVCIAAVLVAIFGLRWRHGWAVGVFAFVGILFNPIVPIEWSPGMWHLIDIGVAVLFLMAVALVAPPGDAIARRLARLVTRGHVDTLPARAVMMAIALLVIVLGAVAFTTLMLMPSCLS